jgi:hypothetical protein
MVLVAKYLHRYIFTYYVRLRKYMPLMFVIVLLIEPKTQINRTRISTTNQNKNNRYFL